MSELASPPQPPMASFTRSRSLHNTSARIINRIIIIACYAAAIATMLALFLILGYILYRGITSINLDLFTKLPGPPGEPSGLRNAIAGTLVLIGMASCVGIPLGMLCGIYLAEYARENWFAYTIRLVVDVLAGVPSIIVGVLAFQMLVIAWHPLELSNSAFLNLGIRFVNALIWLRVTIIPPGFSAWAGMLALAFMMVPVIARTTEEMLKLVPKSLREASIGLGASRFQTLVRVIIPSASAGIITGIMLSVARIAGETAPLLFTILGSNLPVFGKTDSFPYFADLSHPFPSLTLKIYEYSGSAEPDWIRQAWAGMLILIVMVLILNIGVRIASTRNKFKAQ